LHIHTLTQTEHTLTRKDKRIYRSKSIMQTPKFLPSLRSQISHELKTPISSLLMLIEILAKTQLSKEQQYFIRDISYLVDELTKAQKHIDKLITIN